jgi:hypothetical protein
VIGNELIAARRSFEFAQHVDGHAERGDARAVTDRAHELGSALRDEHRHQRARGGQDDQNRQEREVDGGGSGVLREHGHSVLVHT